MSLGQSSSSLLQQQQQVPIVVLKEGASERKGKDAQRNSIAAAKVIAELLKSSLGPRGMDKMLVDSLGDVTITNDGATILKEMDVQHPAAKMMVEVAKSVDNEVGDGTTSAVVLAGTLLENAEELLVQDVHPTIIVEGYQNAAERALEVLRMAAKKINPLQDREMLYRIANTSMASKMVSSDSPQISNIVLDAALSVVEEISDQKYIIDIDNIKVEKKAGRGISDTELIKGIVLDKEIVHAGMPKRVENAKIALINSPLEIEKTEMSAEIRISDPQQIQMFLQEENRMLRAMVDKIKAAGANVALCQKGIDDIVQHFLAIENILAVRRVNESDMTRLSKATGARIVGNIDELSNEDLGSAELVEERKIETDKWVFIEGCKNPKAVTILVRAGSQRVVDEAERSIHDAIMAIKDVIEYPYVVAGGGAPEAFAARHVRDWAKSLSGRTQLAAEKFADSLEELPLTLAKNAGMDPLDAQVELRAKVDSASIRTGIDVFGGKIADMSKLGIYEPLAVKEHVINAATEAASMILRVDDVIAAAKTKGDMGAKGPGGYGPGGYGGYE
jgi:archaeal chaperonin